MTHNDIKTIPVYRYPACYAEQEGELDLYRESFVANVACKETIEITIATSYDAATYCLDAEKAARRVIEVCGLERVVYVLANTIRQKEWDGRFSAANKQWAKTVPVCLDPEAGYCRNSRFVVDKCSPGLTDLLVNEVRRIEAIVLKDV